MRKRTAYSAIYQPQSEDGVTPPPSESRDDVKRANTAVTSSDTSSRSSSPRSIHTTFAVETALEEKGNFEDALPPSLREETAKKRDCVAPFGRGEIVLGPKLGSGEFSHVYEVKSFNLQEDDDGSTTWSKNESKRRGYK